MSSERVRLVQRGDLQWASMEVRVDGAWKHAGALSTRLVEALEDVETIRQCIAEAVSAADERAAKIAYDMTHANATASDIAAAIRRRGETDAKH